MPSEIMDQRMLPPTSYFVEEIHFPAERQVGFWNPETRRDHKGVGTVGMSQTLGSQSIMSSSLEKYETVGAVTHPMECMELALPCPIRDQSSKLNLEHPVVGTEKMTDQSMTSWRSIGYSLGTKTNVFVQPATCFVDSNKVDMGPQYENGLFPSSLSEIFRRKLRLPSNDVLLGHSVDAVTSQLEEEDPFGPFEDIEARTIGNLLPDDDDLISNEIHDMECIAQPTNSNGLEDLDLFSSGGGMELEGDDSLSSSEAQGILDFARATSNGQLQGLNRSSAGKHPYGEHPSRTLFVRNINSNIEDSELRVLFEQYGDIRTLYTACKHRGFVMISYYDIRAASNAMKALQNRLLRRRKLDIHFSIPKDNPSEKDINQGTLVVFNLDLSVSNDELRRIFGVYGEIKEIHETLHKHHHKFIEFYDVRDAEAALNALNRSDIAGKRIKLELSNLAYTRRLMQQVSANLDQEESSVCLQQGSPPTQSSLGCFGPVSHGVVMSSCTEKGAAQGLNSAMRIPINPFVENEHHCGPSPSAPKNLSSVRVSTIGNQCGLAEPSQTMGQVELGLQKMPMFHPHSLPDQYHHGLVSAVPFNSACAMGANICLKPSEGINNRHIGRVDSNGHSIELNGDDFGSGNGSYPLHGHEYIWRNSSSYHPHHHLPSISMWPNSPSIVNGVHGHHSPQLHGLPRAPSHTLNPVLPIRHHPVGSAPAVNSSLWNRRHAYAGESHESSCFLPVSLGSKVFSRSLTPHPLELASHNIYPHVSGNFLDPSLASTYVGLQSPQQRCRMFPDRNSSTPLSNSYDGPNERFRSRRNEVSANQADNKKQYELDINRIVCGEDTRTTLMIKNIPNKYTSKMLLAAIDEHHRGTYDFVYLPIDFKNKCNVGYAFINMINPLHIIPFYQTFNGKKWEKFNSEKVASLAYARIQGKVALVAHFQNSSLMNEDKRCRPILFHSDGPNAGDQEPFPMGINIQTRPSKPRSNDSEENHEGSPSTSNEEESSNGVEYLSGSSKG